MACPEEYEYEVVRDALDTSPSLPRTPSGRLIELRISALDVHGSEPRVNLAWQTVPSSGLPSADRVFMHQVVGDVIVIDGLDLEITGICDGRVTFGLPG